jgi:hypothetical protein
MSWSVSYGIPTSPSPASGTWSAIYVTGSGGAVVNLNGVGYGELLSSQTGESLSINGVIVQPYESATFTYNKRISQLLEPMTFRKHLANGEDRVYVLNPTVDVNQRSTTLKHISLGDKADQFIFDGTTRFSYQLLPYATVNLQFEYTKVTNFVMGDPELIKMIVALNKKRNEQEKYLSGIAQEYTIGKNVVEMLESKKEVKKELKKQKSIIDLILNR